MGLQAIHSANMTHRDVKPSNLFLTRDGQVKLLDLGLVLSSDTPLTADERLTTVGHLMGTVPYMAREQLVEASRVDCRADIYSLGATLYRMLAGCPPYGSGDNLVQTIQAIHSTPCPSISTRRSDLPIALVQIVDRMLHHDPAQRPDSAQQVADLLQPFCESNAAKSLIVLAFRLPATTEDVVTSSPQSAVIPSFETPARKNRWTKFLALALYPLFIVAGIVLTILTDKGTLVIETEEPGVVINVTQGEELA